MSSWAKKYEQAVNDELTCIDAFNAQPFDASLPGLRLLQSVLVASTDLADGFRKALIDSKRLKEIFLQEWVFTKSKRFCK